MDADGDLDIISTSVDDSTVAWYENNGAADPTFAAADIATNVSGPHGIHVDSFLMAFQKFNVCRLALSVFV